MVSKDLTYNLLAKDVSATSTMSKLADTADKTTARIGSSFGWLGGKIGGEFGEILNNASEGFTKLSEAGEGAGTKLAVAGGGIAALGVAFMTLGSGEKAAGQQLDQAISATGASVSDYTEQIDKAISKGEDFGHSGTDTKNALARLTETTNDVGVSLSKMPLVMDIAAAKHESLTAAAQQLSLAMNGNSRVFKQFGIDIGTTHPTVEELNAALDQLSHKLSGQAAASTNTFDGQIQSLRTHLGDWAAETGTKIGPALTAIGSLSLIAGTGMDIMAARAAKAATANLGVGASAVVADTGITTETITTNTLSDSMVKLRLAEIDASLANERLAVTSDTAATGLEAESVASQGLIGRMGGLGASAGLAGAVLVGLYDSINVGTDAMKKQGVAMGVLNGVLNATTDGIGPRVLHVVDGLAMSTHNWMFNVKDAASALEVQKVKMDNAAAAAANLATEQKALDAGLKVVTDDATSFSNALKELTGDAASAADTQNTFLDSVDAVGASVKTNGQSLDISNAAGRKNNETVMTAIANAQKHAEAVAKETGSIDQANAALNTDEDALRQAAAAAGLNTQQIDAMIQKYGGIPQDVTVTLNTNFESQLATLNNINDKLSLLQAAGDAGTISADEYNTASADLRAVQKASHHASGGVLGGQTIDEAGWEALKLPNGTTVIPHGRSEQMARNSSGGGDTHYHVTVNAGGLGADSKEIQGAVIKALELAVGAGKTALISRGIR